MIKRVNVRTTTEIRNIQTPIFNSRKNITMNTMDIRTCLMKGAYVDEILNNGTVLRLNLYNYNKDNNATISTVLDVGEKNIVHVDSHKDEPVPVISNNKNNEIPVISYNQEVKETVEAVVEETPKAEEAKVDAVEEVKETVATTTNKSSKKKR